MRDDFAVFIITHGRPDKQMTLKTLKKGNYTGKLYFICDDEDETVPEYEKKYGKESVKVFHKASTFDLGDNLTTHKGVPVYARNASFDIAKELGLKYFVQLDDDYPSIKIRYVSNGKLLTKDIKDFDKLFEGMRGFLDIDQIYCVAFAVAGDYIGGASGRFENGMYRNARNSFFCSTEKKFEFLGRINEDVTTPAYNNMLGRLFYTVMDVCVTLYDHAKNDGGSSGLYNTTSLYWNYSYPVMWLPSAVKIRETSKGEHIKHISWNNLTPKVLNERWKK